MADTATLNVALTGRYTIERELGAGGMAVVYLADDLRHRRKVALKVLRPELAAVIGADRFLREIETTANLQHPHILPLHDSGTVEGTAFYVMPYVEGESLRDRLRRETQLSVDDAVRIAREIAAALDYAHRRGVIHRDIKPENILLHDGQALVADFGIALAVSSAGGGTRMTETGMSLGTPHYMSPEQAMGDREITARSDVYALGCVLYEMLLGEPPFTGPSAQAVIARVVTENPRSLVHQRRSIPLHVEAAVHKALEKLPADRFASAAEFSTALVTPSFAGTHAHSLAATSRSPARDWLLDARTLAALGVAALLAAAAWFGGSRSRPGAADSATLRVAITPPDSLGDLVYNPSNNGPAAVSPDGNTVAFSVSHGETSILFVKYADRFETWRVPGGGRLPAFSPDGRWLAFHRGAAIWKVRLDGGEPVRVGELSDATAWSLYGLAWHSDGSLFSASTAGLSRIPSAGGVAKVVLATDTAGRTVLAPSPAPDGRLLVTLRSGSSVRLALVQVDGSGLRELPDGIEAPGWFVGDILLFTRAGQLSAARFDLAKNELLGEPIAISGVSGSSGSYGPTAAFFDASSQGSREVVWITRSGAASPVGLPLALYRHPRLSPDAARVATTVDGVAMFVFHLATGARNGVSAGGASEPVWMHDGRRIVTSASPSRDNVGLTIRAGDGSQVPDTIVKPSRNETWPTDITRDDDVLAYYGRLQDDPNDIGLFDLRSKQVRRIALPGEQRGGRFSPDGRWFAYQSSENGRSEIIVQPWPALNATHTVSIDGGDEPSWSRDGRELYFRQDDRMMAVPFDAGTEFRRSAPVELFRGTYSRDLWGDQSYDVAPDGRFLMLRPAGNSRIRVQVIYNWAAELRRKLDEAN